MGQCLSKKSCANRPKRQTKDNYYSDQPIDIRYFIEDSQRLYSLQAPSPSNHRSPQDQQASSSNPPSFSTLSANQSPRSISDGRNRSQDPPSFSTLSANQSPPVLSSERASPSPPVGPPVVRLPARQQLSLLNAGFRYNPRINYDTHPALHVGRMANVCTFCNAMKFYNEKPGFCCSSGKVKCAPVDPPPGFIQTLFSYDRRESKDFLNSIRSYNSLFSMTSLGVRGSVFNEVAPFTFRIQGQVYHRIGPLQPDPGQEPQFLQVYFTGDSDMQLNMRCGRYQGLHRNIIATIQELLERENRCIQLFKTLKDRNIPNERGIILRADRIPSNEHPGRFHLPTTDEVALVLVDGQHPRRDIILELRNSQLKHIDETHPYYDALQYPLIFWRGQATYHFNLRCIDPHTGNLTNEKLTSMDFYQYHLMLREGSYNYILRCGFLLQQFVVDMWAKIEGERLRLLRMNQTTLRAEEYIHLQDAVASDRDPESIGRRYILPSSHPGSPRHMHEYVQDALAYVARNGRPDLFITMTCNANWPEIVDNLFEGQPAMHRHDIVARVFRQKLTKLIEAITKLKIFGPCKGWLYSIEWQKRGLPHAHMVFWLSDRLRPESIDHVISAEIPDKNTDPALFGIVSKFMVHGPCGALNMSCPCMKEAGRCAEKYPRAFIPATISGEDGYPQYRRRSPQHGGHSFQRGPTGRTMTIDNSWIVPYSPILSRMFSAHINVEYCNSIKSIKYLFKYIAKGSDLAIIQLRDAQNLRIENVPLQAQVNENDEISLYQIGRYISSNEAFWRIYGFSIHERYPSVTKLVVHLENGQRVTFTAEQAAAVANRAPPATTLTEFFRLCSTDDFARTLKYIDIPHYYTWKNRKWSRRKQGQPVPGVENLKRSDTIGRIYTVHPNNSECFFLRLLLLHVKGPTSFSDIRTVSGTVCGTYREACRLLNLLESDVHWVSAMSEGSRCRMPAHLRQLFATILCFGRPMDASSIWEKFKESLSEDILNRLRRERRNLDININFNQDIFNESLILIEDICLAMTSETLPSFGLPAAVRNNMGIQNNEILRETSYEQQDMQDYYDQARPNLTNEQAEVFNEIVDAIEANQGSIFFIDAPGGTGKTYLLNLILNHVRLRDQIILATATSGIASTLLFGGRTAHSTFKLPPRTLSEAIVTVSRSTHKSEMLKRCRAIIIDECTMLHKHLFDSINLTLQDIRENSSTMGGAVVILAGDFRQTLPVVPRGTPADTISACLKFSHLWRYVRKCQLSTNMRVQLAGDEDAGAFARLLKSIGDGTYPMNEANRIRLSSHLCQIINSRSNLIETIFPNLVVNMRNMDWLSERAILAPLNETVDELNSLIIQQIPGAEKTYYSVDSLEDPNEAIRYPTEVLNSLSPTGMPPHKLVLKEGACIMLIRNFRPPRSCNGTLYCIKKLHNNMIEAVNLKGPFKGETLFIPRIYFDSDDLFVKFRRRQFPVRVAFALTINKSQGQSYKYAGIDLSQPCFSHGQLYVAFSRVGKPSRLFVCAPNNETLNIVYNSVWQLAALGQN